MHAFVLYSFAERLLQLFLLLKKVRSHFFFSTEFIKHGRAVFEHSRYQNTEKMSLGCNKNHLNNTNPLIIYAIEIFDQQYN